MTCDRCHGKDYPYLFPVKVEVKRAERDISEIQYWCATCISDELECPT